MHICFISHEYPKKGINHGGIGTFLQILGRDLVKRGHFVSVVGTGQTNKAEFEEDEGVHVYRIQRSGIPKLNWIFNSYLINQKIAEIHNKTPIDIIESPEMALAFVSKIEGIKYLIRMNGGHHFFAEAENRSTAWWRAFQEKRSFSKADFVCAVSEYVAETTRRLLHLGNIPIQILYNPANTERFKISDPASTLPYTILFVGSICKKKGVEELVQAMPMVLDKYSQAKLLIVGRDVQDARYGGSFVNYLKNQITNTEHAIEFVGPVSNSAVAEYIAKATVCVYPSYMEALPLAWLEVLSSGKPFIGSETGPGHEVVKHKETGLLVNPRNPEEIAKAIIYIFENPSEALAFGEAALKDVHERFAAAVMIEKNISYYNSILN
jgi:glycosyltransferase involved in cell wall biosynthesis